MNERKMSHEVFDKLLDELDGDGNEVLKVKNARYSAPDDALHNFRAGANFTGLTPAQTCWGYMSKHLIALKDMIDRNDFSNREDFLEKCKDPINYLRILWAIGNDEEYWKKQDGTIAYDETTHNAGTMDITVYENRTGIPIEGYTWATCVYTDQEDDSMFVVEYKDGKSEVHRKAWSKSDYNYSYNKKSK